MPEQKTQKENIEIQKKYEKISEAETWRGKWGQSSNKSMSNRTWCVLLKKTLAHS
jgi:hypothetical protein